MLALVLLSIAGCVADPGDPAYVAPDTSVTTGPPRLGSMMTLPPDGGTGDAATTNALVIDTIPEVTHWTEVPVSGRGPRGGRVLIDTEVRGTIPGMISNLGTFCVDVPLVAMEENTLVIRAQDEAGEYSEPLEFTVRQEGMPPAPTPVMTEVKNIAQGADILRKTTEPDEGTMEALTDGNHGTYVELWNDPTDDDWLILSLTERANVNRIKILTTENCTLHEAKVYLTDSAAPSDPIGGADGWMLIAQIDSTNSGPDMEFTFDPMIARYLGIEFIESGCESDWSWTQYHELREVEVWTADQVTLPTEPPQAPSCISGDR